MTTAARLEHNVGDGIKGIKETMKNFQSTIKMNNEKADQMEKDTESYKQRYLRASGQQEGMRDRIIDIEERLEKNEGKSKDIQRRLNEKEKFLEESKLHNNRLRNVSDVAMVAEAEERLNSYKAMYEKNYEKYQESRKKKIELDQVLEKAEIKSHTHFLRAQALKTELEYSTIEEARRSQGCKDAIEAAERAEKTCIGLQRGLDSIMKRKEIATNKTNRMEKEVNSKENALETLRFERRRNELTIKEMLISLKSQAAQE